MKTIILILTLFILLFLEMECSGIFKSIFPNLYENQFINYLKQSKEIDDFKLFDTLKTGFDEILSARIYKINEKNAELGFVLFNKKGNKAIIFYYEHDDYKNYNGFDYIHIMAAFFNSKTWVFETNDTPTLGLNRKELNKGKPFTYKGFFVIKSE